MRDIERLLFFILEELKAQIYLPLTHLNYTVLDSGDSFGNFLGTGNFSKNKQLELILIVKRSF